MVEYINQNITKLEWQLSADSDNLAPFDYRAGFVITGSSKFLSVWRFIGCPGAYEQLPIIEIASKASRGSVSQVHLIGKIAFVAFNKSTVSLHELVDESNLEKSLNLISETNGLHNGHLLNDMLFSPPKNSVITCGNDGTINYFDIEKPNKFNFLRIANSSLKCIDMINQNEIVCGTLTGSLKHYDLRAEKVTGTFSNKSQSTLTCVKKNPNVNHLVIGGNDEGFINFYDLRNEHAAVAKIQAHTAAVTDVKYKPRDSSTMYTSSCDGLLMKWINADFNSNQRPKANNLVSSDDCFSINCFDVNQLGQVIYATDQEALHYIKPDKLNE